MKPVVTLPNDFRGEQALHWLPDLEGDPEEVMYMTDPIHRIDAWGGAVLRCAIEFHGRHQQRRVTISSSHNEAWPLVHGLVREDHPAHLVLSNDCEEPEGPLPSQVLLPARQVDDIGAAERLAEELFGRCEKKKKLRYGGRFLSTYLPELVQNAMDHGPAGPVPPVACAFHDQERAVLQLVVLNIGTREPPFDGPSLKKAVSANRESSLGGLWWHARKLKVNASLTVVSGDGSAYEHGSTWTHGDSEFIAGFCAAITVNI